MKTFNIAVIAALVLPVGAQAADQLSNLTNTRTNSAYTSYFTNSLIQPFTTGAHPFELNSVTLHINGTNDPVKAALWTSLLGPDFSSNSLSVGPAWSDVTFSFGNLLLAPNTTYYMSLQSFGVYWGGTTDNAYTSAGGWVLPAASGKSVSLGISNVGYNFMMKIEGVEKPVVPEPSSGLVLMAAAGSMLGVIRRKRQLA